MLLTMKFSHVSCKCRLSEAQIRKLTHSHPMFFPNVRDKFSRPCKRIDKIAPLCILMFTFSECSRKDTHSVPNCSRCSINIICSYFHARNFDLLVCIPNIWSCHICKGFICYLLYCTFPVFYFILQYNYILTLQRVKFSSIYIYIYTYIYICIHIYTYIGAWGGVVVKALRY
jgi:hypothetical protein